MDLPLEVGSVHENRRAAERHVPASPVTIFMENGRSPLARGVVANISVGGACVWARGPFEVGDEVVVQVRFDRSQAVPATGRVIWSGRTPTGTPRFGVAWTNSGPPRSRLEALIAGCS